MNHSSRWTSFGFGGGGGDVGSPMAESTQLERGAGDRGGGGSRLNLFGSPVRSSPSSTTVTVSGGVKRKPTSPLLNSKTSFKSSGNLSGSSSGRIDPQVYTDAQSRGLVNRLVRYHDKSQSSLNRSHSMTSLYTKPGQFPVVHLKKTEIKYSPRRNNSITSVRIAPPEKSVFQANTRSNILRAGSLLIPSADLKPSGGSRQQSEEEIDAENRVIAPTAEVDAAPTRSVLDALKEISRKRINNEELDADRIKKQCKELSEVDSGAGGSGAGVKRAREMPSSTSPPTRGSTDQQKKRMCQKNNDILSSLSSSLVMATPKRVEPVQMRPNRLNVDQSFSAMITPAAAPAFNATIAATVESRFEPAKLSRMESAPLPQFARPVPEVAQRVVGSQPVRQQPTQPRITLFNKKYDESQIRLHEPEPEQDDDEELGGRISFIKPKEKSPIVSSDKLALKRVEKNKLSLLLSCLSDDFDNEDEVALAKPPAPALVKDTVDAPRSKAVEPTPQLPKITGISALINNPIKDAGLGKIDPLPPSTQKPSEPAKSSAASGGFSFGTSTATTTVASSTTTTPATVPKIATSTISFGTSAKSTTEVSKPATGGFSFGTPAAGAPKAEPPPAYSAPKPASTPNLISFSPAPTLATSKPATTETTGVSFGTTAAGATAATTATTVTQASTMTFGGGTSGFSAFKPAIPSTVVTASTAPPAFGTVTTATTAASSAPPPSSGGFSFGAGSTAKTAATTTPITAGNAFSFGGAAKAAVVAPTPAAPVTTSSAAPAFGTGSTPFAFGMTSAAPPTFGATAGANSAVPAFGSSTSTSTTPSFGSIAAATTTTTSAPAPTFGGFGPTLSTVPSSAPTTAPPAFGSTTTSTSTTSNASTNLFGSAVAKPAFGQTSTSAGSSFAFGGGNAATPAPTSVPQPATQAGSNATFSFGASNALSNTTNTTANVFGTGSSNGPAKFGGTTGGTPAPFGMNAGAAKPPAFGASATTTSASAGGVFGTSSSVFGASTVGAVSSASSVFGGASATAPAPSPFGTAAPAQSGGGIFGAAAASINNNQNNNNNQSQQSAQTPFAFGGASAAQSPATAVTTNKPFAFGGPTNAAATPAAAQPVKANSFSFSAGTNQAAPAAATPLGQSNSAFSFGASQQQQNNAPPPAFGSTNSAFSFSASNSNATNNTNSNLATVKPFSFGGSVPAQPAAAPAGGIFGGAAATATAPPAFNFSASSNQQQQQQQPAVTPAGPFAFNSPVAAANPGGPFAMANGGAAATPMFSIGTGGGNQPPGRRPIRTATRRLK